MRGGKKKHFQCAHEKLSRKKEEEKNQKKRARKKFCALTTVFCVYIE